MAALRGLEALQGAHRLQSEVDPQLEMTGGGGKGVARPLQTRTGGLSWRPEGGLSRREKLPPALETNLGCLGSRKVAGGGGRL